MIEFTQEEFQEIILKGELFYKTIGEVHCPYFGEKINFNARGLEHLKFKRTEKPRGKSDQLMRFKVLPIVPEILRLSHTVQGVLETKHFEKVRMHSRTDTVLKSVSYLEFMAVIRRNRIRVIIKRIENGELFFWSVIPFWRMDKQWMKRILHEGEPEID